jgi:hypothetical protein
MKTPEKTIKEILKPFSSELDNAFLAYHNHCQRVYYYARTFLLMNENRKLAIAAAFHDLDIWVGGNMNYLPGSTQLAKDYLKANELNYLPDEMAFIINNHHKLRKVKGNIEAEAFRKADLIDLTSGLVKYNIPKSLIVEAERKFPRLKFTSMITGKLIKHVIKHPLKPFPMVRF